MNRAKYIVWNDSFAQAVIFSETINHSDMARALGMRNISGAGFCYTDNDLYFCYGSSISLDKPSRGAEDAKILNLWFAEVM